MARGRMLNTTIATDQKLNSLSIEAEYLFLKAVPHLDRDGLVHGKPNLLWAKVCPERMGLLARIEDLVAEWIARGLVTSYDSEEGPVLFFHGFTKNQSGMRYDREAASIFPPPPGYVRKKDGLHFLTETEDGEPVPAWTSEELGLEPEPTEDASNPQPELPHCEPTPQAERQPVEPLPTRSGTTPAEVPPNVKEVNLNQVQEKTTTTTAEPARTTGGRRRSRQDNSDFGKLCTVYEQEIGLLSPTIADALSDLLDEYKSVDLILDALRVAVKQNKRKLSYVEGILENWRREGRQPDRGQPQQPTVIHVPEGLYD